MDDDVTQCRHMVNGGGKTAKRQCQHPATQGDYCTRHANHPERRNARALALTWEHRAETANQILVELADIAIDRDNTPGDRIRAGTAYLDRTGYGPNQGMTDEEAKQVAEATIELMREETSDHD